MWAGGARPRLPAPAGPRCQRSGSSKKGEKQLWGTAAGSRAPAGHWGRCPPAGGKRALGHGGGAKAGTANSSLYTGEGWSEPPQGPAAFKGFFLRIAEY